MIHFDDYLKWQTPYSKKYGIRKSDAEDKQKIFVGSQISGYTPTEPIGSDLTATEAKRAEAIDNYQRVHLLNGFSAREMKDMGAYPDPTAIKSTLQNPIHPILVRDNWESDTNPVVRGRKLSPIVANGAEYITWNGSMGDWHAGNPIVWRILQPILRLTTMILENVHTAAVVDAFFCGDFTPIDVGLDPRSVETQKDDGPLYVFKKKSVLNMTAADMAAGKQRREKCFRILEAKISLAIGSAKNDSTLNDRPARADDVKWHGITELFQSPDDADTLPMKAALICLPQELLLPFLRKDLSPSEIMAERWYIAIILIHELIHAMNLALANEEPNTPWYHFHKEPFYDKQVFAELGFALEDSLLGGSTDVMPNTLEGVPHIAYWVQSHVRKGSRSSKPERLYTKYKQQEVSWMPIPYAYFEHIQQDDFWDCATKRWGISSMTPQCKWHIKANADETICKKLIRRDTLPWTYDVELLNNDVSQIVTKLGAMAENDRRAYTVAMRIALQHSTIEKRIEFQNARLQAQMNIQDYLTDVTDGLAMVPTDARIIVPFRLEMLLRSLDDDLKLQAEEICNYVKQKREAADYRVFLEIFNRFMREVAEKAHTFAVKERELYLSGTTLSRRNPESAVKYDTIVQKAENVLDNACAAFIVLHVDCLQGIHGFDLDNLEPIEIFTAARNQVSVDLIIRLRDKYDKPRTEREKDTFIPKLVLEAKTTLLSGKQEYCQNLAREIFENFKINPYMRAIAIILLSHDGEDEHKDFASQLGETERHALRLGPSKINKQLRDWWWKWWLLHEKKNGGSDSERGNSIESEGKVLSSNNNCEKEIGKKRKRSVDTGQLEDAIKRQAL